MGVRKRASAKKKGKIFWIYDEVYGVSILVGAGADPKELDKVFRKRMPHEKAYEEVPENMFAFVQAHPDCSKTMMIWFREAEVGGGIAAHECFHAASNIFWASGIKINEKTKEPFAYYLEWLMTQIGRKIW